MRIEKINEHFTAKIEMSEAEIQSLVELFESHAMYRNCPADDLYMGLRGEIYKTLRESLKKGSEEEVNKQ